MTYWNCSGIYGNYVYARELLKNTDILALSEHWLYEDELSFLDGLDSRFCSYATSSSMNDKLHRWKRGQGGVSLLWKKELKIKRLFAGDRMIAIKVKIEPLRWIMVCRVYLPSTNSTFAEFEHALNTLEQHCVKNSGDDDLIILGDFNVHVSGSRNPNSQENPRGRLVKGLFQKLNLTAVNLLSNCSGPCHTYESTRSCTTVDYIWLDNDLLKLLIGSEVLNMHQQNVRHHIPAKATIQIPCSFDTVNTVEHLTRYRITWKKCTTEHIESYKLCLNDKLQICPQELDYEPTSLERHVQKIINSIKEASSTLPHIKYKRHVKPYWNNKLTILKKIVSEKCKLWTLKGRPRGRKYQTFADYKDAKRRFRKEQRRCVADYQSKDYEELSKASDYNYDRFWSLINSRRRNKERPMILEMEDKILDNPQEIAEE